jgi:hypothetical protein
VHRENGASGLRWMSGLVPGGFLGAGKGRRGAVVGLDGQRIGLGLVVAWQSGKGGHGQNMLAPMLIRSASTVVLNR